MRLRPETLLGMALGVIVTLMVVGTLLLQGCTPVPAAQAEEVDTAPPKARQYRAELTRNARTVWGLAAPIPVLAAQLQQESDWNPNARSPVGAAGMCQFMPATARDFPDAQGQVDVYSPAWCLRAQSEYMHSLHAAVRYDDGCNRMGAALSSYNGGLGWHNKRQARAMTPQDFWNDVRVINPGITAANQRENEDYPLRIVYKLQPAYRTWGALTCLT